MKIWNGSCLPSLTLQPRKSSLASYITSMLLDFKQLIKYRCFWLGISITCTDTHAHTCFLWQANTEEMSSWWNYKNAIQVKLLSWDFFMLMLLTTYQGIAPQALNRICDEKERGKRNDKVILKRDQCYWVALAIEKGNKSVKFFFDFFAHCPLCLMEPFLWGR